MTSHINNLGLLAEDRSNRFSTASYRRGVALMLVVVAMGTATVMTTAYLLSKDNSAAIGANAQDTAASVWAANSGADLALAILQTEEDWVDADPEKLLEGFSIAGGTVSIVLTDLQGNPPAGTETELAMTVVADVNGIKTLIQRIVSMQPDVVIDDALDPELEEFGVYAIDGFSMSNSASLSPWPASPMAKAGASNNLGVGFTDIASMSIDGSSWLTETKLFVRPDASASLKGMTDDSMFSGGETLQVIVPTIGSRLPSVFSGPIPWPSATYYDDIYHNGYFGGDQLLSVLSAGDSITLIGGKHKDLLAENDGSVVTLDASVNGGDFRFNKFNIDFGADVVIRGHVTLNIAGGFTLKNGSSLTLADDVESSLRVFFRRQMHVVDSTIGVPVAVAEDPLRDVGDLAYYDPSLIRIYALSPLDGGDPTMRLHLATNSIVCAAVHAPDREFLLDSGSALCGRLTAGTLNMLNGSRFLYDPVFNNNSGFTAPDGPFYKSTGEPQDGLAAALASYDTTLGLDSFTSYVTGNVNVEVVPVASAAIGEPTSRKGRRAQKKHWPFIAKAIESGSWVSGNNADRQEDLYVALDPTIFDLDKFYNDGVIEATYTGSGVDSVVNVGASTPMDLQTP